MSPDPVPDKRELRRKLRAVLAALTGEERGEASIRACSLLRKQPIWKKARAVLLYAPHTGELDLSPLLEEALRAGKMVALPRFMNETGVYEAVQIRNAEGDCAPGKFGISEPGAHCPGIPLKKLDLTMVPGLGFDETGRRLGRGQGFYDRLLAQIEGIKCGVGFDQQIVAQIPGETHDVPMNCILTPTRWLEFPR